MTTTIGYTESSASQPQWYQDLYKNLLTQGQSLTGTQPKYSGALTAGFTPQQTQAGNLLQQSIGQWQPTYQGGLSSLQNALGQTNNAINQGNAASSYLGGVAGRIPGATQYDPNQLSQYLNPYLSGVVNEISRLGNLNLTENILPGIADQYTALGQFGSERQGTALAQAAARAQREISGQQANALSDAYNQAQGAYGNWSQLGLSGLQAQAGIGQSQANIAGQQGNLANQIAGIGEQQIGGAQAGQQLAGTEYQNLFGYGQQSQQTQQNQLTADYQEWLRQQQSKTDALKNWSSSFNAGQLPTTSSVTQTQFKRGGLAMAGGGLMGDDDPTDVGVQIRLGDRIPELGDRLQMSRDLFDRRMSLADRARSALQPIEEPPWQGRLGRAMLEAAAQGPANFGQLIGRSGAAYYEQQDARRKRNQDLEKARLELEDAALPSGSGAGGLGGVEHYKMSRGKDGSLWAVSDLDPRNRTLIQPGGYEAEILGMATKAAENDLKNAQFESSEKLSAAREELVKYYQNRFRLSVGETGIPPQPRNTETPVTAPIRAPQGPSEGSIMPPNETAIGEVGGKSGVAARNLQELVSELRRNDLGQTQRNILQKEFDRLTTSGTRPTLPAASAASAAASDLPPPGTILTPQETKTQEKVGTQLGEQYSDLQKAARSSRSKINQYDRAENLLEGVQTGRFSPMLTNLSAWASDAGQIAGFDWLKDIDPMLPNKEAADAIFKGMALELRNPSGGAGMPGAMSDADRDYLVKMAPNLRNTAEGNKLLFEGLRKLAQREIDVARLAREYRSKNPRKSFDEGFETYLAEWAEKHPLFEKEKPKSLKIGDRSGNYRFKGGDPSEPSSWEKVK